MKVFGWILVVFSWLLSFFVILTVIRADLTEELREVRAAHEKACVGIKVYIERDKLTKRVSSPFVAPYEEDFGCGELWEKIEETTGHELK